MNFWVMTKSGKPLDEIVMDLRAWRCVADDEPFASEIAPIQFLLATKLVIVGQHHEYPLSPKLVSLAVRPLRCARDERHVKPELADRREVVRRIAIYEFDPDLGVAFIVRPQQFREES